MRSTSDLRRPVVLIIMDGWAQRDETDFNAVANANTPNLDRLTATWPHTLLEASGESVGLPAGQFGNSEVGHLNIGAGRIVYQDIARISNAIRDGSFWESPAYLQLIVGVRRRNSALHLFGLIGPGGVHSLQDHLTAIVRNASSRDINRIYLHAQMDGRDTPPRSGKAFIGKLLDDLRDIPGFKIASVGGRYWGMDRDKRWDRIERSFRAITSGEGHAATDPLEAIQSAYDIGETDEFIKPIVLVNPDGLPVGRLKPEDGMLFFNFRADRVREMCRALTEREFPYFKRPPPPLLSQLATMTRYDQKFRFPYVFPPISHRKVLAHVLSTNRISQLHIAESEKYAHVTYFFNGGREKPFPGEDRIFVPSPKVATYDLQPEMSAYTVRDVVANDLKSRKRGFIVVNFANADMVGHTGVYEAAIKAVETVDACVGDIAEIVLDQGGAGIITADHGNSDRMRDADGNPHTQHTSNPVPCILLDEQRKTMRLRSGGKLCDIAPTLLEITGLSQPSEMTGRSLLGA